eukprot:TRINITY_DN2862_c0_g2_i1.p1 TRINITY_DN2862_c0_g2~~TRINITY_DN2862_c0_g2_i1.p1  ORF type:complete len:295 (+),score=16.57 TRINITY_DN2862_c0_g2_i1:268-1152(+)
MCWSAEVSLYFVLIETTCLMVAVWRMGSRALLPCAVCVPFILQELLQYFLWLNIGVNDQTCNQTNVHLSLAVTFVVGGVPLWINLWAYVSLAPWMAQRDTSRPTSLDMAMIRLNLRRIVLVSFVLVSMLWLYSVWGVHDGWYPYCTYAGPWGHQIWPVVMPPNWFLKWLGYAAYGTIISAGCIFYHGPYPHAFGIRAWMFLIGPSNWALMLVVFFMGPEFGSLWCWSAFGCTISMAVEPELEALLTSWGVDLRDMAISHKHIKREEVRALKMEEGAIEEVMDEEVLIPSASPSL